ncbi:MAG TPA: amino acid permease [Gemmataceae bacterium]|jgi:APA family basic amino acid/polyamine antiporter|nr:amino acid permease [Gemmataceae bacterium]
MLWKRLFATKSLETLHKEMQEDEGRLRRVLGPIGLTSLGIGAIIGAGIFVMTGRVAAEDSGPAIVLSYAFAGVGCALAAFCYAEFASMVPVAGSAYTYAYATLGELLAWIIGWDLILEYAMSAATVGSAWSEYFNEFMQVVFGWQVPEYLSYDPFSKPGAIMNLPAVFILLVVTTILVIGIRESAISNTALVLLKLGVVVLVIVLGVGFANRANWTEIPYQERKLPTEALIPDKAEAYVDKEEKLKGAARVDRIKHLGAAVLAVYKVERIEVIRSELENAGRLLPTEAERLDKMAADYRSRLPATPADEKAAGEVLDQARAAAPAKVVEKWGLIGEFGLNDKLVPIDEKTRSNYTPYGLSGIMLGAALVFFAFIGFDSISTHAEEAVRPQRDVPFGILASLAICTVLYVAVSAVITGMVPYPDIDTKAAVAAAFRQRADAQGGNAVLRATGGLIAAGGLAGMTSVLLITFLSQARIFLAMARDGLMSRRVFGAVHHKFKTPHVSTVITGTVIAVVAAFTPIQDLEKMVNIGTLFAFIVVCAAVLILRVKRPDAHRPFRCPALFVVAPVGILVNLTMMLFLPVATWWRLVIWLAIGLVIYFSYGYWRSSLGKRLAGQEVT